MDKFGVLLVGMELREAGCASLPMVQSQLMEHSLLRAQAIWEPLQYVQMMDYKVKGTLLIKTHVQLLQTRLEAVEELMAEFMVASEAEEAVEVVIILLVQDHLALLEQLV